MTVEWKYRTFWRRFWAGYVDAAVFVPLAVLDGLIWQHSTSLPLRVLWFAVYSASAPAYNILMLGLFGQTVGKRVLGVRVVDVSGRALTMTQALRREAINLPFALWFFDAGLALVARGENPHGLDRTQYGPSVGLMFGVMFGVFVLELLTTLTNSKRRALHDFIAGSVVVRTRALDRTDSDETYVDETENGPAVAIGTGQFACLECGRPVNFGASQCTSCDQSFDYENGQAIRRRMA
jgi:uncharacterized RDD family membrane protein YckC